MCKNGQHQQQQQQSQQQGQQPTQQSRQRRYYPCRKGCGQEIYLMQITARAKVANGSRLARRQGPQINVNRFGSVHRRDVMNGCSKTMMKKEKGIAVISSVPIKHLLCF